jgi:hypothetical protein
MTVVKKRPLLGRLMGSSTICHAGISQTQYSRSGLVYATSPCEIERHETPCGIPQSQDELAHGLRLAALPAINRADTCVLSRQEISETASYELYWDNLKYMIKCIIKKHTTCYGKIM